MAVNASGVIVGAWGHLNLEPLFPRAFLWQDGVMQDFAPDLAPPISQAFDINDHGAITGWMGSWAHGKRTPTPKCEQNP
jgi:probable HAF family extracellular repeat protein